MCKDMPNPDSNRKVPYINMANFDDSHKTSWRDITNYIESYRILCNSMVNLDDTIYKIPGRDMANSDDKHQILSKTLSNPDDAHKILYELLSNPDDTQKISCGPVSSYDGSHKIPSGDMPNSDDSHRILSRDMPNSDDSHMILSRDMPNSDDSYMILSRDMYNSNDTCKSDDTIHKMPCGDMANTDDSHQIPSEPVSSYNDSHKIPSRDIYNSNDTCNIHCGVMANSEEDHKTAPSDTDNFNNSHKIPCRDMTNSHNNHRTCCRDMANSDNNHKSCRDMAKSNDSHEIPCSYKLCSSEGDYLTNLSSRVEVQSYVPKAKTDQFTVDWDSEGQAVFHKECWKNVLETAKNTSTDSLLTIDEQKMITDAKKTAEYFDSYEEIKEEGKKVAKMIMSSSHATVFTGAGISTSAGIGDYRGKGGKWTERDRKKKYGSLAVKTKPLKRNFKYERLRPTYTHEALAKLVEMGHIKYVMSQNVDGIHRLSGLPRDKISELHGNAFHEKCEKCDARYERPYAVGGKATNVPPKRCSRCRVNHRTGRKCERMDCDGYLMNTIINFGDDLEDPVLDSAIKHAEKKDLMLCLGSTLSVTPACDLVTFGKEPLKVVICNRQPTQFDDLCNAVDPSTSEKLGSRVFGDCDVLMKEVMNNFLSAEELQEWEEAHDQRMAGYDKLRIEQES